MAPVRYKRDPGWAPRVGRVGLAIRSPDGLGDRYVSVLWLESVGTVRIKASLSLLRSRSGPFAWAVTV